MSSRLNLKSKTREKWVGQGKSLLSTFLLKEFRKDGRISMDVVVVYPVVCVSKIGNL